MAFDFPNAPTTGMVILGPGGIQFQWDGVKWIVVNAGSPGFAPINSPVFSGDPQAPTAAYGDNDNSLSDTAFVQNAVTPLTHNVGRNFIHNGLFNIQQRGQGPWTTSIYTVDRWQLFVNADTVSLTAVALADADRAAIGDEAAVNAVQSVFTGSSSAGAYNGFFHKIEGLRRLSGKQCTVSFWARATSGAPRIGVVEQQIFGSGGSPSANMLTAWGTTAALSSTWQRYIVTGTFPSTAGKTFGTTAGTDYVQFGFWLSDQANNSLSGIGVQSGTVQFWGMQLEIGSQATPLEKLDPRIDLSNCQRFYEVSNQIYYGLQADAADTYRNWTFRYLVQKRAVATITFTSSGSPVVGTNTVDGWYCNYSTGNTGTPYNITAWTASADL